jgi:hypothetical protein
MPLMVSTVNMQSKDICKETKNAGILGYQYTSIFYKVNSCSENVILRAGGLCQPEESCVRRLRSSG